MNGLSLAEVNRVLTYVSHGETDGSHFREAVRNVSMGIRVSLNSHLLRLMSAEDQARYGAVGDTVPGPHLDDPQPPRKGLGLRLAEAFQLEQNGVARRLHATPLPNQ